MNKDIVLHQSFDELRQNGTGASVFTPGQSASWDNKAVLSADITSLYYHGWVALKGAPGQLGYQIDDLVSLYNQHNLGTGATTWWDNAGDNDMTIQLSESSYLAADGLHTAGTKHYFPEAIVDVVNGNAFTVELLFGDFVSIGESYNTFLNSGNDNFALFRRLSDDVPEFKFAANSGSERHKIPGAEALLPNSLITVTYTVGGECVIYVNGVAAATKASPSAMGANNLFIGQTEAKDFRAVYQSIRFYDRALTAAEVLSNAQSDGKA